MPSSVQARLMVCVLFLLSVAKLISPRSKDTGLFFARICQIFYIIPGGILFEKVRGWVSILGFAAEFLENVGCGWRLVFTQLRPLAANIGGWG